MKRILCFGDSNTWGYIPSSEGERYHRTIRYPRVLGSLLGNDYEIIEEGLPGRTMCSDDLKELVGNRNGRLAFGGILYSSLPLDYILIILGSNDLKYINKDTAKHCAESLEKDYIYIVEQKLGGKIKNTPKIIIVAPSVVGDGYEKVSKDVIDESKYFNEEYQKVAEKHNCLFVDNNGLETGSDYIHLTEKSHLLLAEKIYKVIKDYESSK